MTFSGRTGWASAAGREGEIEVTEDAVGHDSDGIGGGNNRSVVGETLPKGLIGKQCGQLLGEVTGITGAGDQTAGATVQGDDVLYPSEVRDEDRCPEGHGFDRDHAEGLTVDGRIDDDMRGGVHGVAEAARNEVSPEDGAAEVFGD